MPSGGHRSPTAFILWPFSPSKKSPLDPPSPWGWPFEKISPRSTITMGLAGRLPIKIPQSLRNMKSETDNNITVDNYIDGITTKQEKKNLITLFSILFLFFLVMSILTMISFLMIQYQYSAITTIMLKVFSILMFMIFSFLSLYCFIMLMKIRKKKI